MSEEFVPVALDRQNNAVTITDKILLIDADTLVYATAVTTEQEIELLPKEFYTKEEWQVFIDNPTYDKEKGIVYTIDIELAYEKVLSKLQDMLESTGANTYELHFTVGKESFRYSIIDDYKGNRTGRVPLGNNELKELCHERLSNVFLHTKVEADDVVCSKYDPTKHILCAVDKDVLYNLVGTHWNYYSSAKHGIEPKWVTVDEITAMKQPYIQTLTGDKQDNIITGLKRVGIKTAEKILKDCTTPTECWNTVVETYKSHNLTEDDAVRIMRLVNMFQYDDKTKEITLFTSEAIKPKKEKI